MLTIARSAVVLLALGSHAPPPTSQPEGDWLRELIADSAAHRDALQAADVRNGKLFNNPSVLADIAEPERFASESGYAKTVSAASARLRGQFPVLREAFAAGRVEASVNVTTGMVYLRGRAENVDFAAVVPATDVTGGGCSGHPWSITFVRRIGCPNPDADLRTIDALGPTEQARLLTRYLSPLGDVLVEELRPAPAAGPTSQPGTTQFYAHGAFRTLKIAGHLRIVATPVIVHIELADIEPPGLLLPKPSAYPLKRGPRRQPDWLGPTNVYFAETRPSSSDSDE